jgi:predicted nucleotide-binding protein
LSTPAGVKQHLAVHLFAPATGARAAAGFAALRELWLGCEQFFKMDQPLPHGGLPHVLPPTYRELAGASQGGEEAVLAARERPDADCQAFLRRHHDVLNLSVLLAAPTGAPSPASGHSWWQDLDAQWSVLADRTRASLLGEARLYLARSAAPAGGYLDELLPAAARIVHWRPDRAAEDAPVTFWEAAPWTRDRALRRLVLTFPDDTAADAHASAWAWSDGDTAIPLLARYLLHAVKLRDQYRVWQRDDRAYDFIAAVKAQVNEALQTEPGELADTAYDGLRRRARQARLVAAELRELRQSAEIAGYNMAQVVASARLLSPAGPFADDRNLARNFLARLDDELSYLDIAAVQATEAAALSPSQEERPSPAAKAPAAPADVTRNVFVVHGRDEPARTALFDFIKALGLHPLGWETLVRYTGSSSPYLRDVIMQGIASAQAAVVLMTPDDEVRLHPDLRLPNERQHELSPGLQARPNVLLELGMALATYAERTIVLYVGEHRPIADLAGLNYVQLTGDGECLDKLADRLRTAGCHLDEKPPGRRARARFRDLAAYRRNPPSGA